MTTQIISKLISSDDESEALELWQGWMETDPSREAIQAFFTQLLSLPEDPEFDAEERFFELWNFVEDSLSAWDEKPEDLHWRLSKLLYEMAEEIDTDTQSIVEVLANFAESHPNHQESMRLYLEVAYDKDWFITDLEDSIEKIKDPAFSAECYLSYAKVKLGSMAWSGDYDEDEIMRLVESAKIDLPSLDWEQVKELLEEQGFDEGKVAGFKAEHFSQG